jgi:hypothetical protein
MSSRPLSPHVISTVGRDLKARFLAALEMTESKSLN